MKQILLTLNGVCCGNVCVICPSRGSAMDFITTWREVAQRRTLASELQQWTERLRAIVATSRHPSTPRIPTAT